jgi:hypothetical protein
LVLQKLTVTGAVPPGTRVTELVLAEMQKLTIGGLAAVTVMGRLALEESDPMVPVNITL